MIFPQAPPDFLFVCTEDSGEIRVVMQIYGNPLYKSGFDLFTDEPEHVYVEMCHTRLAPQAHLSSSVFPFKHPIRGKISVKS